MLFRVAKAGPYAWPALNGLAEDAISKFDASGLGRNKEGLGLPGIGGMFLIVVDLYSPARKFR